MSLLASIERGRAVRPPRILVYGPEGVGKSTFASKAPSPIFICTEDGIDNIGCDRFPLATDWKDVSAALRELRTGTHDYQTVVIDSADWLERLIWDKLCQEYGVNSIEKVDGGYAKGYTHALTYWREVVSGLNALRSQKDMAVIIIAHAKIERFEDPESSSPYDRYSPRLNKHASALLVEWSDAVCFAARKIRTQSETTGFNRKRTTAVALGAGGGDRVLRCTGSPACTAKNRFGISQELPLDWSAFIEAATQKGVNTNG